MFVSADPQLNNLGGILFKSFTRNRVVQKPRVRLGRDFDCRIFVTLNCFASVAGDSISRTERMSTENTLVLVKIGDCFVIFLFETLAETISGGSALTDKKKLEHLKPELLICTANQIAEIRSEGRARHIIIHGAGSFGHFQVSKASFNHPEYRSMSPF